MTQLNDAIQKMTCYCQRYLKDVTFQNAAKVILEELEKLRNPTGGNWRWVSACDGRVFTLYKGDHTVLVVDRTRLVIKDIEGLERFDEVIGEGESPSWEDQKEIIRLLNATSESIDTVEEIQSVLGISDGDDLVANVRAIKDRNAELEKHMVELHACGEKILKLENTVKFLETANKELSRRNEDLRLNSNKVQSECIELEEKILKLENKVSQTQKALDVTGARNLRQTERFRELRNILGIDDGVSLEKSILKLKNKNEESDIVRKLWTVMDPYVVGSEDLVQRVKEMKLKNIGLEAQVKQLQTNADCARHNNCISLKSLNKDLEEYNNSQAKVLKQLLHTFGITGINKLPDVVEKLKDTCTELNRNYHIDTTDLEYKNTNLRARVKQLVESESSHKHCVDCCCARLWEVLGITEYDGKDIFEHVQKLKTENGGLGVQVERLRERESALIIESNEEVGKLSKESKSRLADFNVLKRRLKTIEGIAK